MITLGLLQQLGRAACCVMFGLIACAQKCPAELHTVRIMSEDRSPLGGVLVIVRRLEHGPLREVGRNLSGSDGRVPEIQVTPGLYQIVAVDPYGPYDITVEEVLGERWSGVLDIVMKVKPLVNSYKSGMPKVALAFTTAEKHPADEVSWCLFRNRDAQAQFWVHYMDDGEIELPDEVTYAACLANTRLYRFVIASDACSPELAHGEIPCYSVRNGKVVVPLKAPDRR